LAEFGVLHRNEISGALTGTTTAPLLESSLHAVNIQSFFI
jgi:threonyl-tRNA synthetase